MNFARLYYIASKSLIFLLAVAAPLTAQSTNQNNPTPVKTSEINGTINARDVGDARLTSYFYQFDGDQGDLFINIVTRNLTGDIDVFTMNGLRPLTKIVVYADLAETETGRVIYLRKPEKLILRVQGRTPGDDPATFRIKFAGSFVASSLPEPAPEPELPSVTAKNERGIRVNSVGTIVEIIPKATPTPVPAEVVAEAEKAEETPAKEKEEEKVVAAETKTEETTVEKVDEERKKVEVVVTENLPEKTEITPPPPSRRPARGRRRTPPRSTPPAETAEKKPVESTEVPTLIRRRRGATRAGTPAPKQPDPLEKVNLVILFKDGGKIERPMSEVLRFTVDRGMLTVIAKDGSIGRYSILDVAELSIK